MDFISNIVKGHKHPSSEDQPEDTSTYGETPAAGNFDGGYKTPTSDDTSFGGGTADGGGYGGDDSYKSDDTVASDFPSGGGGASTEETQVVVGDSYSDYPSDEAAGKSQGYSDNPGSYSADAGGGDYAGDVSYSDGGAPGGVYSSRVSEDIVNDPQSGEYGGDSGGRYSGNDY
ncbi:hypothetical protein M569_11267 [Genlisea aurea]|uniref:Uncharacterized protein n=1 Tax=Genlisea aurea TaxID=192259 RepID=S8DKY7_9LAMI|nr:hypothetical protein M569_11267 [Genlisea aurea]